MSSEVPIERLYRICDPGMLGCVTSAEVSPLGTIIGQERAVRALEFGLGIKERGFNIFVAGRPGTGRTTAVRRFLEEVAKKASPPQDWCYVHNFRDSYQPNALALPADRAAGFRQDMETLVKQVSREILNLFESEEYATHREQTIKSFQIQKQALLERINEQAQQESFMIQATPMGVIAVPARRGKPLTEEEYIALEAKEREAIEKKQAELQDALEIALRQAKGVDKSTREALIKLDREAVEYAIKSQFDDLGEKYQDLDEIILYLDHVRENILDNVGEFRPEAEEKKNELPFQLRPPKESITRKYLVNVLVDHANLHGAPVVVEGNPTYTNLFGRIEQEAQFGALYTNFTLIRKGALHQANGGYLVLPAEELLRNPLSWESLKRALQNREITIEDAGERLGLGMISTKSLRPEPIPLDVKVILIGRPDVYQILLAYDEDFSELFKVKVDFDSQMPRSDEHVFEYAAFVCMLCEDEKLRHLDSSALARIVEHSSRLAGDQEKLSTRFAEVADVIREANYYASIDGVEQIGYKHIRKAIEERFFRSALIQERIQEMIARGVIKIDILGQMVGQVNGLSVIGLGDIAFGQPNRITVSLGLGRGGVINIEREAEMSGPTHTKGVLILSGYLADQYTHDKPLGLTARVVFEQSYSGVDGDSASSAELYALLSALSGIPIRQYIAVTGSVNQKGEVQAIGGVNEKIEGYFEVCQLVGLTGKQGVMIPESNVDNLMLKEAVVEAVKQGKFHIWSVKTIDEGIEILTGVAAGKHLDDGTFEPGTVHARVDAQLHQYAQRLIEFGREEKN